MVSSFLKRLGVGDYETIYPTKENVNFFNKSINLSASEELEDFIIKPCSEEDMVNIAPLLILKDTYPIRITSSSMT